MHQEELSESFEKFDELFYNVNISNIEYNSNDFEITHSEINVSSNENSSHEWKTKYNCKFKKI